MTHTMTDPATALADAFRGDIIRPGDLEYDGARKVYNGMIANIADSDFAPLHEHIAWAVDCWESPHPLSAEGAYGNSLLDVG